MEILKDSGLKSLEDFPVEILSAIFSDFCSHCRHVYTYKSNNREEKANVRALNALSQTSRRCRSLALPILFHFPHSHLESTFIFRVLDHERDLALFTKTLFLPLSGPSKRSDQPVLTQVADRLSPGVSSVTTLWSHQSSVETSLLLALCSNVERMTLQITDSEGKEPKTSLAFLEHIWKNRESTPGFPNLRYLEVDTNMCKHFSIAGPELTLLLHESPALETLVLKGTKTQRVLDKDLEFDIQKCSPALRNLTTLEILGWSFHGVTSDTNALVDMLSLTKNLKSFTFTTEENDIWENYAEHQVQLQHIPPTRFIQLLKPLQRTLKHLTLDFDDRMYARHYQVPNMMVISPQQIKSFFCLESLHLDLTCYCHHLFGRNKAGLAFDEEACLADFLPQTVRDLTILFTEKGQWECWYDVLHLGKRAMAGDFPNLRRVIIRAPVHYQMPCNDAWDDYWDNQRLDEISSNMKEREEEFREAFDGSGVNVVFRTWFIWVDMY